MEKMIKALILTITINGILGGIPCGQKICLIGDSRFMDGPVSQTNVDYLEEDEDIFTPLGISGSSILQSISGSDTSMIRNCDVEIWREGVNGETLAVLNTQTTDRDIRIYEKILSGRYDLSISVGVNPGTTWTSNPTIGGVNFPNCFLSPSGVGRYTIGQNKAGYVCSVGSAAVSATSSFELNSVVKSGNNGHCWYVLEGDLVSNPSQQILVCESLEFTERNQTKVVKTTFNKRVGSVWIGDNSQFPIENRLGKDWKTIQRAAPLTTDGVHGDIDNRRLMNSIARSVRKQCSEGTEYDIIEYEDLLTRNLDQERERVKNLTESISSEVKELKRSDEDTIKDVLKLMEIISNLTRAETKTTVAPASTGTRKLMSTSNLQIDRVTIINNQTAQDTEVLAIALGTAGAVVGVLIIVGFALTLYKKRLMRATGPE